MRTISETAFWKLLSQPTNQQVIDIGLSPNASAIERARAQDALKKREEFLKQNFISKATYIFDRDANTYRRPTTTGSETVPVDMLFIPETYRIVGNRIMIEFGEMLYR